MVLTMLFALRHAVDRPQIFFYPVVSYQ